MAKQIDINYLLKQEVRKLRNRAKQKRYEADKLDREANDIEKKIK
jgi:hypothetical protein